MNNQQTAPQRKMGRFRRFGGKIAGFVSQCKSSRKLSRSFNPGWKQTGGRRASGGSTENPGSPVDAWTCRLMVSSQKSVWNRCDSGAAPVQTGPAGTDWRDEAADTLAGIRCSSGPRLWSTAAVQRRDGAPGVMNRSCRPISQRQSSFSALFCFRFDVSTFSRNYPPPCFSPVSCSFH